jgi:outer membrane protein insertion porin family
VFFPISNRDNLGLRYNLRSDDLQIDPLLTDCSSAAFFRSSLCDQQGRRLTSQIGYTLSFDRTNSFVEPTRGFEVSFSQDLAGLGGDVNYLRNEIRGGIYRGLFPNIVASARLEAGYIESWNDDVIRINNRFFKGGSDFRGFDVAGLGPREVQYVFNTETIAVNPGVAPRPQSIPLLDANGAQQTNSSGQLLFESAVRDAAGNLLPAEVRPFNALGGKAYAVGTLELSFPIPYAPEEFGIDGAFFAEFGTVGLLDDIDKNRRADEPFSSFRVDDSASLRASAGVSIFWDSPFGPVRFDFSQLLAREEYDRTESFRFSTNTRF